MKKGVHIKETLLTKFLRLLIRIYSYFFYGFRTKNKYNAKKGEKLFIVSNHQTDLDPVLVRLSFNRYLYSVVTDNVFSKKFSGKLISLGGGIPKRKGLVDLKNIKDILNISSKGASILIFPEGNRSYAEFQFFISESIVKLIKKTQATLIIYNFHGGFGVSPRFSAKRRKGPFYGEIKKILSYEEYKDMDNSSLAALIKDNIKVFDYLNGYEYKSNKKAEYLERMYFVCPNCSSVSTLKSSGDYISCSHCGLKVKYDEHLNLISDNPNFKFNRLVDWYKYQKDFIRNFKIHSESIIFSDDEVSIHLANPFKKRDKLGYGTLVLTDKKLMIGNIIFKVEDIEIASPISGRKLCLTINGDNYEFRGNKRFNALKYVLMFNKLDTKMRINKSDEYYTL